MPTLKTTVTAIQFAIQMSYRHGCAVVLYFVFWSSGRNAVSLILFFQIDLLFAMTQAGFCKYVQHVFCKNIWRVYVLHGVRMWKATLNPIWPVRLKQISRNAIWIGFQTTYECSSKLICTNLISSACLLMRFYTHGLAPGSAWLCDLICDFKFAIAICQKNIAIRYFPQIAQP